MAVQCFEDTPITKIRMHVDGIEPIYKAAEVDFSFKMNHHHTGYNFNAIYERVCDEVDAVLGHINQVDNALQYICKIQIKVFCLPPLHDHKLRKCISI